MSAYHLVIDLEATCDRRGFPRDQSEIIEIGAVLVESEHLKPVDEFVEDVRRSGARKAIFLDLNIIANKEHAAALFEALIPLKIRWYGLATALLADDETEFLLKS